ncbi:MAG TPA: hypothetical protein VG247_17445 [Pseudonocardiaceae bacterium]|jgi:hypothetical protein|nr:hypothetical protein [Pseudonocardiaceae bacterium]
MSKVIGVIAAVLVGAALAGGVAVAVTSTQNPDRQVNVQQAKPPTDTAYGDR